ncbi:MAG: LysR family transcriptional regulator [Clostridia bacterium]|nr:LysR family transcriptional regulator [Clostridia bacterium]
MDIRTLSYFVVVAEELNITKAAEKLKMSQPPLSSQMKSLEEELNTVLFIRGKRHLQLTESGQLLYRRAKEILNLTEKASSEIISMSKGMTGTISIGLVEGMAPDLAAEWFAGFMNLHPEVRFRILDGNSDDLFEKLRSGIISLAVITAPCDNSLLNSFSIGTEKMVAFMMKDHPLALKDGDTISISDLVNERLIVPSRKALINTIYKWFKAEKAEPNIVCEMDSYLDAAALAGRGVGISLYPRTAYIPNDSIIAKEIEGSDRTMEYLFSWRKGHPLPTVEEAFIDYVKEHNISNS